MGASLESLLDAYYFNFLAKPQSWGEAPRFDVFPVKFTPGCAGPPSAPPATMHSAPDLQIRQPCGVRGRGGAGVVLLGAPRNENMEC
jgi:hypothetical protein